MSKTRYQQCERCGRRRAPAHLMQCGACGVTRCYPKCHEEHLTELRGGLLTANANCLLQHCANHINSTGGSHDKA